MLTNAEQKLSAMDTGQRTGQQFYRAACPNLQKRSGILVDPKLNQNHRVIETFNLRKASEIIVSSH